MESATQSIGTMADSQGANHLEAYGVTIDAVNYREGAAAGDWEVSEEDLMVRADAALSSDFPWKSGTTNYSFSACCWIKPETLSGSYPNVVWSKGMTAYDGGHCLRWWNNPDFRLQFASGVRSRTTSGLSLAVDQWYYLACTYNETDGVMRLYIYDATAGSVLYNTTTTSAPGTYGYPIRDTGAWYVGHWSANSVLTRGFDGLIDEFVVFNRALSVEDIELIRDGLYPGTDRRAAASMLGFHF
jgi:hypothetical protein